MSNKSNLNRWIFLFVGTVVFMWGQSCHSDVIETDAPTGNITEHFTPRKSDDLETRANNIIPHSRLMAGYAAYQKSNGDVRWYIAKQRLGTRNIPSNNPDEGYGEERTEGTSIVWEPNKPAGEERFLDNHNGSHVERQLIICALRGAVQSPENPLNAQGTLYVYTRRPPCCEHSVSNGNYACYEYYNALANRCAGVTFNVYFTGETPCLDTYVLSTLHGNDYDAINTIIKNAMTRLDQQDFRGSFKLEAGQLTFDTEEEVPDFGSLNAETKRTFISNLNNAIKIGRDGAEGDKVLTDTEVETIIRTLYKINGASLPANLHYHVTH